MKKAAFLLIPLMFVMVACNNGSSYKSKSINLDETEKTTQNTGALSSFDLISPTHQMIVDNVDEFKWQASANAETYTLEIASSDQFQSDLGTVDYYKRENIVGTSFKINATFSFKETTYYWRVIAKNSSGTKYSNSVFNFYIKAPAVEEFEFDVGEADDWSLHPLGSYADISIDKSNFFGNNKDSLKLSFKHEDLSRGIPESDGWIVVTRVIEKSIYGTDALYFNCFYAGQEASVIIRLVDRDNEYWYCPVQLSVNSQQSIILKFSDFIQRTGDVTVANEKFDYERIKYWEIVFEATFGDGVFLISDMKAIKFSNYNYLFITKLNFSEYDSTVYTYEAYDFEYVINDDYELELPYYNSTEGGHAKINGYGFVKINVNKYMISGDAIKVSVKYQGSKGSNVLLRIYEEDTDRWSYKIPFSNLTEGEYATLVIPFAAFAKSSILGDGKRQFYYIYNLQFGLEGEYGNGKVFFKDFEVVNKKDYVSEDEKTRTVGADGLIEDFSTYTFACDIFNCWILSDDNKDEYIQLDNTHNIGNNNTYCGRFDYKADMSAALYYLPITAPEGFTSLTIWLKDGTVKPADARVEHIESVNPDTVIYIRLKSGEIYVKELKALSKIWHEYDIPFESFTLSNGSSLRGAPNPIRSESISHVGFSLQYFYYDAQGKPMPCYFDDSPVYCDNIALTNFEEYHASIREKVITMVDNIAVVDDFEAYESTEDAEYFWNDRKSLDYQHKELSNNVSSQGGSHSIALQYQTNSESPSYVTAPAFDSSVSSKAFTIDIASEFPATVYVNFYVISGTSTVQYRATLTSVNTAWTKYAIGLNVLSNESGTGSSMSASNIVAISMITIGVTYYNGGTDKTLTNIYVDNIKFDATYTSYNTNVVTVIDA